MSKIQDFIKKDIKTNPSLKQELKLPTCKSGLVP